MSALTHQSTLSMVDLTEPPRVAGIGRGRHGVRQHVDDFVLLDLWSLHLYAYAADVEVDGVHHNIVPGSLSLVPPAAQIRFRYRGPSRHLYAHLAAPYAVLPVPAVAPGRRLLTGPGPTLEVMVSPGADLPDVTDLMESAVTSAAAHPARSRADLWMLLLRLVGRADGDGAPRRSAATDYVTAAMSVIEARLTERLTVGEIAREVGISADHLTRVFSAETGQTVIGYVRRRRVQHAERLLRHTTMSVSAIAATVGIPDLQAFNKTCRSVAGRSPRQLREGSGSLMT